MKRVLTMVLTVLALAVPLASAALASDAELSDVMRPVDAVQTPPPQYPTVEQPAPDTTIQPQALPEPLRLEAH